MFVLYRLKNKKRGRAVGYRHLIQKFFWIYSLLRFHEENLFNCSVSFYCSELLTLCCLWYLGVFTQTVIYNLYEHGHRMAGFAKNRKIMIFPWMMRNTGEFPRTILWLSFPQNHAQTHSFYGYLNIFIGPSALVNVCWIQLSELNYPVKC